MSIKYGNGVLVRFVYLSEGLQLETEMINLVPFGFLLYRSDKGQVLEFYKYVLMSAEG